MDADAKLRGEPFNRIPVVRGLVGNRAIERLGSIQIEDSVSDESPGTRRRRHGDDPIIGCRLWIPRGRIPGIEIDLSIIIARLSDIRAIIGRRGGGKADLDVSRLGQGPGREQPSQDRIGQRGEDSPGVETDRNLATGHRRGVPRNNVLGYRQGSVGQEVATRGQLIPDTPPTYRRRTAGTGIEGHRAALGDSPAACCPEGDRLAGVPGVGRVGPAGAVMRGVRG